MMTNVSNDTVTLIIRCVDTGYYKHDQNVAIQGCCGGCLESDRWPRRIDRGLPRTNPEEGGERPRTVRTLDTSLARIGSLGDSRSRTRGGTKKRKRLDRWIAALGGFVSPCRPRPPWKLEGGAAFDQSLSVPNYSPIEKHSEPSARG